MKGNCYFIRRVIFTALTCLLLSVYIVAQQDSIIKQSFQPLVDDKSHVGIVVGVLDKRGQKMSS